MKRIVSFIALFLTLSSILGAQEKIVRYFGMVEIDSGAGFAFYAKKPSPGSSPLYAEALGGGVATVQGIEIKNHWAVGVGAAYLPSFYGGEYSDGEFVHGLVAESVSSSTGTSACMRLTSILP